MCSLVDIRRVVHPIDEVRTVARQQAFDVQRPFLELAAGDERCEQRTKLTIDDVVAFRLSAMKFLSECREMISDLAATRREISRERRIDARQFTVETIELDTDVIFRVGE